MARTPQQKAAIPVTAVSSFVDLVFLSRVESINSHRDRTRGGREPRRVVACQKCRQSQRWDVSGPLSSQPPWLLEARLLVDCRVSTVPGIKRMGVQLGVGLRNNSTQRPHTELADNVLCVPGFLSPTLSMKVLETLRLQVAGRRSQRRRRSLRGSVYRCTFVYVFVYVYVGTPLYIYYCRTWGGGDGGQLLGCPLHHGHGNAAM